MQQIIINLLSGLAGGNVAGALLKKLSLGPIWNSVVGLLGGGLGGQLISMLSGNTPDAGSMLGGIASSAVGGGALMATIGFIKKNFLANQK